MDFGIDYDGNDEDYSKNDNYPVITMIKDNSDFSGDSNEAQILEAGRRYMDRLLYILKTKLFFLLKICFNLPCTWSGWKQF